MLIVTRKRKKVCNRCIEVCNHCIKVCNRCTLFLMYAFPFLNLRCPRGRNAAGIEQKDVTMGKRVRVSNETLNSFGTWIVTAGMDTGQYSRNPVLLYMHRRGEVIGYLKDIKVENGEVTGEPVFDEASELSVRAKKQFEFGSLRMVSAGIDILELSEDPELLKPGQTRPTITKSKLVEVSIVDVGSNDDALVLTRNGVRLELGKDGSNPLPLINNKPSNQTKQMELQKLAQLLGLAATATEAEVEAKIADLNAAKQEADTLRQEKETMVLSAITQAVETGIAEKRIPADKKDHFIALGKTAGLDALKTTIASMTPVAKVSAVLNRGAAVQKPEGAYAKLSEVPEEKLEDLRENHRETYIALFKAEYGFAPTFGEE